MTDSMTDGPIVVRPAVNPIEEIVQQSLIAAKHEHRLTTFGPLRGFYLCRTNTYIICRHPSIDTGELDRVAGLSNLIVIQGFEAAHTFAEMLEVAMPSKKPIQMIQFLDDGNAIIRRIDRTQETILASEVAEEVKKEFGT